MSHEGNSRSATGCRSSKNPDGSPAAAEVRRRSGEPSDLRRHLYGGRGGRKTLELPKVLITDLGSGSGGSGGAPCLSFGKQFAFGSGIYPRFESWRQRLGLRAK